MFCEEEEKEKDEEMNAMTKNTMAGTLYRAANFILAPPLQVQQRYGTSVKTFLKLNTGSDDV